MLGVGMLMLHAVLQQMPIQGRGPPQPFRHLLDRDRRILQQRLRPICLRALGLPPARSKARRPRAGHRAIG